MYLKSITLKGFKSFPDRTALEFGPGVSVIVGPNGSGKSNVTDAVLWALGEQSPVAVRGQSMQDVIFGGAPGRQAGKSAEVELVLDDSEGRLGLGAPEISIVRRLDRSGDGEYRLAGARCRLVDVIELLSDTGMGKEMHSVISQGRVEAIVTSKPRDRRLLIEEAAGLGKHRKRRRRAQLKLARTQDNLDRALDVEREARSRLRPLKRQAEAAELHARLERQSLEARWELGRDQLRAQLADLQQAQTAVTQARDRREQIERRLQDVSKRRETAEEALAARSARREELSRRCFVAQSAGDRVSYRAESVKAAAATHLARLDRQREALSALRAQAAADAPDEQAARRIAELERELAALDRDREAELARQLAELQQQRAAAGAELAARVAAVVQSLATRERGEALAEQARLSVREAERAVELARRDAARVGGELAAVNQFLRTQRAAAGGASTLADELEVDGGYELALAAALDGRLRAAVVDDHAAAGALLDRTGSDGGRALVASAPDTVQPPQPHAMPPSAAAERLLDHVRGPDRALALASALLADTWVVDAIEGVADTFAGVAVTRSGRVWSARARELRQAPAVGEERVLAERNRREQLIAASELVAQAEQSARAGARGRDPAGRAGRARRRDGDRDPPRCAAGPRRGGRGRAADRGADRTARSRARRRPERRAAGSAHGRAFGAASELRSRRARPRRSAAARCSACAPQSTRDEALNPALESVIGALLSTAAAISSRRERFETALAEDREAGEHVAAELRSCAQQEAALHTELHGENEALTALEVRAQRLRDQASDAEQELRELASRLELEAAPAPAPLGDEERDALRTRIDRLARRREQLGPVNPLAQQEYAEALEHVEELERQRSDLETALRELEKLIADTDRQIRETFEETFEAAARNFEELAEQLFPGGRGRLRLVAERDGPARVLGGQPAPVDADEDAGVDGQDREDREDGEEPEDRAEEDLLGVEIEITPAGKAMKRLTLLSGGEKSMTALAFLFAVFLAKPCPFYILDEVEAALDDLNIDRFLALLRQYSKRAQFIVVTHQKRTMEAADSLYGVSMGGDGISKVISRRLPPAEVAA